MWHADQNTERHSSYPFHLSLRWGLLVYCRRGLQIYNLLTSSTSRNCNMKPRTNQRFLKEKRVSCQVAKVQKEKKEPMRGQMVQQRWLFFRGSWCSSSTVKSSGQCRCSVLGYHSRWTCWFFKDCGRCKIKYWGVNICTRQKESLPQWKKAKAKMMLMFI